MNELHAFVTSCWPWQQHFIFLLNQTGPGRICFAFNISDSYSLLPNHMQLNRGTCNDVFYVIEQMCKYLQPVVTTDLLLSTEPKNPSKTVCAKMLTDLLVLGLITSPLCIRLNFKLLNVITVTESLVSNPCLIFPRSFSQIPSNMIKSGQRTT